MISYHKPTPPAFNTTTMAETSNSNMMEVERVESDSAIGTKRRKKVSDTDRVLLRRRFKAHPSSQSQLAEWFREETGRKLGQATISEILSSKYDHLDEIRGRKKTLLHTSFRIGTADHPDLESTLFEWQQRLQDKKATITGDILKAKAHEVWVALPQKQGLEEPKWSNGWLDRFKRRYGLQEYITHGEAGAAEIDNIDNIKQMDIIRAKALQKEPRNILNFDETGLFWKQQPNRTLATYRQSGGKKSKNRYTVGCTTNADGSDEYDLWVIGQSKRPRSFKKKDTRLFGIKYRYNDSKWMTTQIMVEYLEWLNLKLKSQNRHVLLLMDNFSAHTGAVEYLGGKNALSHVEIEWLPPNTTSVWQPLDQGIIASFKLQYRKMWVAYMIKQFDNDKNPLKTVTLLHSIRWAVQAWRHYIKSSTIKRCWLKSTCIYSTDDAEFEIDDEPAIQQEVRDLHAQVDGNIQVAEVVGAGLSHNEFLRTFITPESESIDDKPEEALQSIIERYSVTAPEDIPLDEDPELDEDERTPPNITQAIDQLITYEEAQEEGDTQVYSTLQRYRAVLQRRQANSRIQRSLYDYFTPTIQ